MLGEGCVLLEVLAVLSGMPRPTSAVRRCVVVEEEDKGVRGPHGRAGIGRDGRMW